jgi:hypothetical protein
MVGVVNGERCDSGGGVGLFEMEIAMDPCLPRRLTSIVGASVGLATESSAFLVLLASSNVIA